MEKNVYAIIRQLFKKKKTSGQNRQSNESLNQSRTNQKTQEKKYGSHSTILAMKCVCFVWKGSFDVNQSIRIISPTHKSLLK